MERGLLLKVVTVDDSTVISDRLNSMLRELYQVAFLGNARRPSTALSLIHAQKPDVVILDIQSAADSPDVNGMDLLASLRILYPSIKLIALTNLSESQYRHKCIALGGDFFLDKSHDFDKIPEILNSIYGIKYNFST